MEKPASIRRVELTNRIISDINAAKLPPYVIQQILERVMVDVNQKIEIQYQSDLKAWTEAQQKEAEDAQQNVQD